MKGTEKKVFIVTSGSYSDYGIEAVFSSRVSAQSYIDAALKARDDDGDNDSVGNVHWAGDARIEEWPLNSQREATVYVYWTCGVMLDDGAVVEPPYESKEFGVPGKSEITQYDQKVPHYDNRPIIRVRSLKSSGHAIKMAAEARQKWLREKA